MTHWNVQLGAGVYPSMRLRPKSMRCLDLCLPQALNLLLVTSCLYVISFRLLALIEVLQSKWSLNSTRDLAFLKLLAYFSCDFCHEQMFHHVEPDPLHAIGFARDDTYNIKKIPVQKTIGVRVLKDGTITQKEEPRPVSRRSARLARTVDQRKQRKINMIRDIHVFGCRAIRRVVCSCFQIFVQICETLY